LSAPPFPAFNPPKELLCDIILISTKYSIKKNGMRPIIDSLDRQVVQYLEAYKSLITTALNFRHSEIRQD
jgi:hypothetical protein